VKAEAWQSNREGGHGGRTGEFWGGWRKRGEILENCDVVKTMLNDTQSYFRRHNLETHSLQPYFFYSNLCFSSLKVLQNLTLLEQALSSTICQNL